MVVKCVEGQEGVMSVETGSSYNGGHRSGGAACGLTLKLQKEGSSAQYTVLPTIDTVEWFIVAYRGCGKGRSQEKAG